MTSISHIAATAVGVLKSAPETDQQASILSFLQSDSTSFNPPSVLESMLKTIGADSQLQDSFESEYAALMAKPENAGISIENGQHNALFETIMKNRDAFPAQGFTIKTEFPGGGSIETTIPASAAGGMRKSSSPTKPDFMSETNRSAAFAKIINAIILDNHKWEEDRLEATQDQIAERYE